MVRDRQYSGLFDVRVELVSKYMAESLGGSNETQGDGDSSSVEAGSLLPIAPQKTAEILRGEGLRLSSCNYVILIWMNRAGNEVLNTVTWRIWWWSVRGLLVVECVVS